jgi:hypothetical protein
LEDRTYIRGENAIRKLEQLNYRVKNVEDIVENKNIESRVTELEYQVKDTIRWCCDEIKDK